MPAPRKGARPLRRRLAALVLLAVLLLAAGAVAVQRWWHSTAVDRPPATAEPADPTLAALDRALQRSRGEMGTGVAIRPLAAADASPDSAAMAESVCSALAERLVRLPALRIVPCRSTSVALAAQMDDVRLARLLAVRYVLKGRVDALPENRLHVRIALHEAASERPAWQIDEQIATGALQALPARVAEATARTLGQVQPAADEPAIAAPAYLLFLRASQLARRPTLEDKQEAYRLNEQVLAAAPDYEPALYQRLGLTSVLSASSTGPATRGTLAQVQAAQQRMRDDIRALGQRLIARDPASWRGHILLLNDAYTYARWAESLAHAEAMMQHAARHPGVLRIAARLFFTAGYLRQARDLALDAARLNALDPEAFEVLALAHAALGEREAFADTLELAAQMGHRRIAVPQALLALRRGDRAAFETAGRAFATATAKPDTWAEPWLRGVLDAAARDAAVQALQGIDENERRMRAELMLEWALLGDVPRAVAALEAIAARPLARWAEDLWWPELAAVRRHAGFARAAERMGLAALWAQRGAPDLCARSDGGEWVCR
ncbi:MAG: hypothetical protein JNL30_06945 [Rubrivivax sp.]|nr:hypothetical protein [Rubrivivax sp.]